MADSSKHSYVLDAVGLIVLFALAMAVIAYPLMEMGHASLTPPADRVSAQNSK